jgi:hypothetical protein
MTLFCKLTELHNESDVEAKLLMPLLLTDVPNGLTIPRSLYQGQ